MITKIYLTYALYLSIYYLIIFKYDFSNGTGNPYKAFKEKLPKFHRRHNKVLVCVVIFFIVLLTMTYVL